MSIPDATPAPPGPPAISVSSGSHDEGPQSSLRDVTQPKGGGAIRGIGENFQ